MRPAVFLDRDGTLLEEAGYLDRLERLVFFPFAIDAVRLLNRAGYAVVIDHESIGRRPGHVSRRSSSPTPIRWWTSGSGRAAATSTATTTARIIRRRDRAIPARLRLPEAGARHAAAGGRGSRARSALARSRSATSGPTCRPALPPAPGASWCGRDTDDPARPRRAAGVEPAAIADDLIAATAWILRQP